MQTHRHEVCVLSARATDRVKLNAGQMIVTFVFQRVFVRVWVGGGWVCVRACVCV